MQIFFSQNLKKDETADPFHFPPSRGEMFFRHMVNRVFSRKMVQYSTKTNVLQKI